ncbi:hypothetical protein BJ912DRAFT_1051700 [Pholiota molesta]|nr:hypothetical protein BJ912DRAFT_1051700 [Pholiota molesta]
MRRRVVVPSCRCTVASLHRRVVAPSRVVVVIASLRIVVIAPSRHCAVASLAVAERQARRSAVRARRFVVVTWKRMDQLVHGPAARRGREPHSGGAQQMQGKRAAVRHGRVMWRVVGGVVVCKRPPVSVDIMHGTWQVAQERKCIQDGNSVVTSGNATAHCAPCRAVLVTVVRVIPKRKPSKIFQKQNDKFECTWVAGAPYMGPTGTILYRKMRN